MRVHAGVHPCMGAVDLIPIYPLGEEVGVEDCAEEARGEKPFVLLKIYVPVGGVDAVLHLFVSFQVVSASLVLHSAQRLLKRRAPFDLTQWFKYN